MTDKEFRMAIYKAANDLLTLVNDRLPDGGHISLVAWEDHVSFGISKVTEDSEIKTTEIKDRFWFDPRKKKPTFYT